MTDKQAYISEIRDWCKYADAPMRKAARWALGEIERLTTENADLKSKLERESTEKLTREIAELTILCVDSKCEIVRLKRRVNTLLDDMRVGGFLLWGDDGKKEVIE